MLKFPYLNGDTSHRFSANISNSLYLSLIIAQITLKTVFPTLTFTATVYIKYSLHSKSLIK